MTTQTTRRADLAGVAIAAGLALIAGVMIWDASTLTITSAYGVGPKMMPIVVACGLLMLAAANLIIALRGDLPPLSIQNLLLSKHKIRRLLSTLQLANQERRQFAAVEKR